MSLKSQTHEDLRRSHAVKASSDRTFGIVFAVVFLVVALWPLQTAPLSLAAINWWALTVAIAFLGVALIRPALLQPANRLWLKFGLLLHRIVNPVVMAVLFFGVITPYGVVMRLVGKDPMRRGFDDSTQSYWISRDSEMPPTSMKNQF